MALAYIDRVPYFTWFRFNIAHSTFTVYGEEELNISPTNNKDGGFSTICDYVSKEFLDHNNTEILYEQVVNQVKYGGNSVEVLTEDGNSYKADFVISTLPLAVLKSQVRVTVIFFKLDISFFLHNLATLIVHHQNLSLSVWPNSGFLRPDLLIFNHYSLYMLYYISSLWYLSQSSPCGSSEWYTRVMWTTTSIFISIFHTNSGIQRNIFSMSERLEITILCSTLYHTSLR